MTRKLILLVAAAVGCCAQARLVNSVGNFIHAVGDLDRSVHFYKDVLGMDVPRLAGDWQTTEGVIKMYDAVGAKFRVANAQVAGSPMRIELAEFNGVDRKPVERPWGTAGTSVLMLTVTDLAPVLERVQAAGVPMLEKLKKECDGRGIIVADPDGFAVMVVERAVAAPSGAVPKSNFTALRFGYLVSDDALAKGPFAALGLTAETRKYVCRPVEEALLNASASVVMLPGGATLPGGFEVWLAKGKPAKSDRAVVRPRDPGAAVLRLSVSDVDAAVQALGKAQVKVVSLGGEVQSLAPGGVRAAILRAPDDLLIQVVK